VRFLFNHVVVIFATMIRLKRGEFAKNCTTAAGCQLDTAARQKSAPHTALLEN
jgi:hypothetical protein